MKNLRFVVTLWVIGCGALSSLYAESGVGDPGAFIRTYYAAYNAAGSAQLGAFYSDAATFVDPSFELNLKGREQIGGLLVKVLAKYETLEHEIAQVTAAGDDLVVEGTMVGKISGKTLRVPFVSVFHFVRGKITAQRDLFDTLHFMVQLGAFPSPFQSQPAAAVSVEKK